MSVYHFCVPFKTVKMSMFIRLSDMINSIPNFADMALPNATPASQRSPQVVKIVALPPYIHMQIYVYVYACILTTDNFHGYDFLAIACTGWCCLCSTILPCSS